MSGVQSEVRHDKSETYRGSVGGRCRIPLRLPPGRPKAVSSKAKASSEPSRPKSSGRKEDGVLRISRPLRTDQERHPIKKLSAIPKKLMNDSMITPKTRPIITVPITNQKLHKYDNLHSTGLPDQATIQQREILELEGCASASPCQSVLSHQLQSPGEIGDREPQIDIRQQKLKWKQNTELFEEMKNDLRGRQKAIVKMYADLRNACHEMSAIGLSVTLPPSDDLTIMNVSKMSPDQLLQLCATQQPADSASKDSQGFSKAPLTVNISKLYNLPTKMVATCDQTINKRKEIIDWFINIKTEQQGISRPSLERKINEFTAENEMLRSSLEQAKGDFLKDLNEIIEFMRKITNEAIALQLRSQEQTYELSELNSQNAELRKHIQNTEKKLKPHRGKMEELEKELNEVKSKNNIMKDRLTRADGQIKIGVERATQLETALEQAQTQIKNLERTVQDLTDQNEKLQNEFDNIETTHLKDIAEDRDKLQAEKEDLEHRLEELSAYYNESLNSVKQDTETYLTKLIDTENKYEKEVEEKNKLMTKLNLMTAQSHQLELCNRELTLKLEEKEKQLLKTTNEEKELSTIKRSLEIAVSDIEDYKTRLAKQSETIKMLERDVEGSYNCQESLKSKISSKEKYIAELENKQTALKEQSHECETKMRSYEEQLSALKNHISKLKMDFGDYQNSNDLRDKINEQRLKLKEITRDKENLEQVLQRKESECNRHLEDLGQYKQKLEQKNNAINVLKEKEEEQANIIELLRNNLEMRTQADIDLSKKISKQNTDIENLVTNVENRKQQISQLEKIILTLEEQSRKTNLLRRKDQEKINALEQQLADYKMLQLEEIPPNNLDSIIRILEDELDTSFGTQSRGISNESEIPYKCQGDRRTEFQNMNCHKQNNNTGESIPAKIVLGNYVQKTYITNDDHNNNDNLDRKKAITKINIPRLAATQDPGIIVYPAPSSVKNNNLTPFLRTIPTNARFRGTNCLGNNVPFLYHDHLPLRDEKKCKMFKLAGHRL